MTIPRRYEDDERWQHPHIPGRVIVELIPDFDAKLFDAILSKHQASVRKRLVRLDRFVVLLAASEIEHFLHDLDFAGLLVDAEPDGILTAQGGTGPSGDTEIGDEVLAEPYAVTPNDPYVSRQWHIANIGLQNAWSITQGGAVTLAMIDSGTYAHPDLVGNLVQGFDFVSYDDNTTDSGALGGHGTATAGTAGAVIGNGVGIAGVAKCRVMPLLVLAGNNYAAWSDVADAMTYAADHGCRVANISIGGTSPSSTLESAAAYAWRRNVVIFASAMNNHNSVVNYPAGCMNVMAVAATNQNNVLASFSNYGTWVDLAAPGQGIFTLTRATGYGGWSGTSFASPICAGVACLMVSAKPSITNAKIVQIMRQTADPIPGQPFGKINSLKCVQSARLA